MTTILLLTTMFVVMFHAAHSYILVSANIDDVKAIAKQIAQSPIVSEIDKMFRRHLKNRRRLTNADYEADNQNFRRSSNKSEVKKDATETVAKNDGDRPEASVDEIQNPLKVAVTLKQEST